MRNYTLCFIWNSHSLKKEKKKAIEFNRGNFSTNGDRAIKYSWSKK